MGSVETEALLCSRCGEASTVRYRTVVRGDVRVPGDPHLLCDNGHVVRSAPSSHGAESLEPGEGSDLIG